MNGLSIITVVFVVVNGLISIRFYNKEEYAKSAIWILWTITLIISGK